MPHKLGAGARALGAAALILLAFATSVIAAPQARVLLGPETVRAGRANAPRGTFTFARSVPVACPCAVHLINGVAGGGVGDRVGNAWVWLDSALIVGPPQLARVIPSLDVPIDIAAGMHTLEIIAVGEALSSVTLTVTGTIPLPDLQIARRGHTVTTLSDGRALVWGGTDDPAAPAEIFDPRALAFARVSGSLPARRGHAAVAMPTGGLWIAGGSSGGAPTSAVELVDGAGTSAATPLASARAETTATILPDGRLFIVGGMGPSGDALASGEIHDPRPDPFTDGTYDPAQGAVTVVPQALATARAGPSATLLPSGFLLVIGGRNGSGDLASIELLDPSSGVSTVLSIALHSARSGHAAVLLPDGSVLVAGGQSGTAFLDSVEIVSPDLLSVVEPAVRLRVPRASHTLTLTSWGDVLVAGGVGAAGTLAHTELIEGLPDAPAPAAVAGLVPAPGAVDVDRGALVSIRFTGPIDPMSAASATISLSDGSAAVAGTVTISMEGLYAFVLPRALLAGGIEYTLTIEGVRDLQGHPVPSFSTRFTVVAAPVIFGLQPDHGPAGTLVVVTGQHFGRTPDDDHVTIDGASVSPTAATETSLTFVVPSIGVGPQPVTVRTRGGLATAGSPFVVENPIPILTALAPDRANAGSGPLSLTLTGDRFVAGATVSVGGMSLTPSALSVTEATVSVPAASLAIPGTVAVFVVNPAPGGGASDPLPLTVVATGPPMTALSIFPRGISLGTGGGQTFAATAQYADGTKKDVSAQAAWTIADAGIAQVNDTGRVAAVAGGATTLEVSLSGFSATASITVSADDEPIPTDPALVAPDLRAASPTPFLESIAFLFQGENPIQRNVAPGAIVERRVAVLRGRVQASDGRALEGARVTVAGHPELGDTLSRSDGAFDLAVNGGGLVTLHVERQGYLPVERQPLPNWHTYSSIETITMTPIDPAVTRIDLATAIVPQVARGTVVTDASGARQASIVFSPGTTATAVMPDGSTHALAQVSVRATEYTAGPNGPSAMPAPLPATSAYTYAVEYSIDEAAGAQTVQFSQPVVTYTDNFLHFVPGTIVPVATYDAARHAWVPSANGRVIAVVYVSGGLAALDVDGSGGPSSPAALAGLGITDAERSTIATLYSSGQSVWRVPLLHFSTIDYNWPYKPPVDANYPNNPSPDGGPNREGDRPDCEHGSIIECQNQGLGERVPLIGAGFNLDYRSARVPRRRSAYTVSIPLSGASVAASLKRIELEIAIAGQDIRQTFPAQPLQQYTFTWDGRDGYGRTVEGTAKAVISVGYVYGANYGTPPPGGNAFGIPGTGASASADPSRQELTLSQSQSVTLGTLTMGSSSGNGWAFGIVHEYDAASGMIYYGDGRRQTMQSVPLSIRTVAGATLGGAIAPTPATQLTLVQPKGLLAAADGSFYVTNGTSSGGVGQTYHVDSAGQVQPVATPAAGRMRALGPDGSIYFADSSAHVVRRTTPDGQLTIVAGVAGQSGGAGDGGPATSATLIGPTDIAVAPDGVLLISDSQAGNSNSTSNRIRRVALDGTITTYAGGGTTYQSVDGPALQRWFFGLRGISFGPDGSLYVADQGAGRIFRVRPSGLCEIFAGNGSGGDGSPARTGRVGVVTSVTAAPDGSVYFVSGSLWKVDTDGIMKLVSSAGLWPSENGIAKTMLAGTAVDATVSPDGGVLTTTASRVARIGTPRPDPTSQQVLVPSDPPAQAYIFDEAGRHLQTLDGLTTVVLYTFEYDTDGRLIGITDRNGRHTTIERAGVRITALTAPGNVRTTFDSDGRGRITAVNGPGGTTWSMGYGTDGLLASLKDPNGGEAHFSFDADGHLLSDEDAASGITRFVFTANGGITTATRTSPEGRQSTFTVTPQSNGDTTRVNRDGGGAQTTTLDGLDGKRTITAPDGTKTTIFPIGDPRWSTGVRALGQMTIALPSGRQISLSGERTVQFAPPGGNPLAVTVDFTGVSGPSVSQRYGYDAGQHKIFFTFGADTYYTKVDAALRPLQIDFGSNVTPAPLLFAYDTSGRVSRLSRGARALGFGYNDRNLPITLTDAMNRESRLDYDDVGRVTRHALPGGRSVEFGYDAMGNLTSVKPSGRPGYTFTYTPLNQIASYVMPGGEFAYKYDHDRNLVEIDRPDSQKVSFTYDGGNRPTDVAFSRGTLHLGYDGAGRLSTITAPGAPDVQYTYDGFVQTSEQWHGALEGRVDRSVTASFQVSVTESVNGGLAADTRYDQSGRVFKAGETSIDSDSATGKPSVVTLGTLRESRGYNEFGDLSSLSITSPLGSAYWALYTRNALGRLTQTWEVMDGVDRFFVYTYDGADRLARVEVNGNTIASYAYDDHGNRIEAMGLNGTFTATYDDADRLLTFGPNHYTYTASGELRSRTRFDQTTSYEYDSLGNLVQVTLPDGRVVRYTIDGRGRRVAKAIDGVRVKAWLYADQWRPIAELDGNGAVISRFVYGSRANVPDYLIRNGVTYRIFADSTGSPRSVLNASTGEVVQRINFSPFGEVTSDSNPGFQPFGFVGGLYDADTGLVKFGRRDYDPEAGRWTAPDPLSVYGGSTNLYAYALDDPLNLSDPSGRGLVGAVIGGVIGGVSGFMAADAKPNATMGDLVRGAVIGAATGGIMGALDPTEVGVAGMALAGLVTGAGGNLADQWLSGTSLPCTDWGAASLAGIGGAAAGILNGVITNAADAIPGVNLTEAGKEFIHALSHPLTFQTDAIAATGSRPRK